MTMNRDYYNSLSEAYNQVNENIKDKAGSAAQGAKDKLGNVVGDQTKAPGAGVVDKAIDAGKAAWKAGKETVGGYTHGLSKGGFTPNKTGKVASKAPLHMRAANALGRVAAPTYAASMAAPKAIGRAVFGGAQKNLKKEEIEALLNSPHLTEEEREAFIAMLDEERKDEKGMSPDEKSIGRSLKVGLNPATDHMAAATRQRLHLSQRGKKKPTAHSKETRLPAQQLKARKANDGVKEMGEEYVDEATGLIGAGTNLAAKAAKSAAKASANSVKKNVTKAGQYGLGVMDSLTGGATEKLIPPKSKNEEFDLDSVLDAMCEGLPEPKVNYLKDMDPYDRRRQIRQHAPGSPLPPPTPGIPDFLKRASKDKKKDTKTA